MLLRLTPLQLKTYTALTDLIPEAFAYLRHALILGFNTFCPYMLQFRTLSNAVTKNYNHRDLLPAATISRFKAVVAILNLISMLNTYFHLIQVVKL